MIVILANGFLASDSRVTYEDGRVFDHYKKKVRVCTHASFGFIGDINTANQLETIHSVHEDWESHVEKLICDTEIGFTALIATANGDSYKIEDGRMIHLNEFQIGLPIDAIGDGKKYALGAYYCTSSVRTAVEAAINYHPACGGEIQFHKVSEGLK